MASANHPGNKSQPSRLSGSLFDHSPADAEGCLPPAEQIPGSRADLQGAETTHHMRGAPWPAQVGGQHRPVVDQIDRTLLLELPQQRVLADALAVPGGKPDTIGLKRLATRAENSPLIGAPSHGVHLALFVQPQRSSSLGLPELGGSLWWDRTAVASRQHLPMSPLHARFSMKGLEVFGPEPTWIGIEGLVLQGPATEQMHQRTPPQRAQGQMGTGEPTPHNQDPLAL